MTYDLDPKFLCALDILERAGKRTRELFESREYSVTLKSDGSPVTEADREIESLIRSAITREFPDDSVLGEEFGLHNPDGEGQWTIDPIDGTKSFIHHVPLYSNLLSYTVGGEVLFGAINLPSLDTIVFAQRGRGAWCNGAPAHVSTRSALAGSYVLATWLESWSVDQITAILKKNSFLRTWGDGFGYMLVATGNAEAMVDFDAKVYDLAPIPVILEEAGGRFTAFDGRPVFDQGTGVGSNGLVHDQMLEILIGDPALTAA